MGGKRAASEPSDLCPAKQSFLGRFEGFSGELSLGGRNVCLERVYPNSKYAYDAAAAPL